MVIGDGTYLMCPTELVAAAQEGWPVIVIVIENAGFQYIRGVQEATTGTQNFGNEFRRRVAGQRAPGGEYVAADYAANARSMGAAAFVADTPDELRAAIAAARLHDGPAVIVARADRHGASIGADAWWDVGVAEVSDLGSTRGAVQRAGANRSRQRSLV